MSLFNPSSQNQPDVGNADARAAERRAFGIYYTPANISRLLAEWAIRTPKDKILEPSFGGCALLEAAIVRLKNLGAEKPENSLTGFDVDARAFRHLRRLVGSIPAGFKRMDFLATRPEERVIDSVIANPPFVGYRHMSMEQRASVRRWQSDFQSGLSKEASLWAFFLAHSLRFLKNGGRVAFVLPTSFLQADYSKNIRGRISGLFEDVEVISVQRPLFREEGADARTCIVLASGYVAQGTGKIADIRVWELESLTPQFFSDFYGRSGLTGLRQLPIEHGRSLLKALRNVGASTYLGDYFQPLIGEVTGAVPYFVRSLRDWAIRGIGPPDISPIISSSKELKNSKPKDMSGVSWLFKPTQPLSRASKAYLSAYPEKDRAGVRTFAKRRPWWNVSYKADAALFTSNVHHREFRLIVNHLAISCTNSLYKLVPLSGPLIPPSKTVALAAMSSITQLSAEVKSRTLGGGGLKLEPSDLRTLALPSVILTLAKRDTERLSKRVGQLMRQGDVDGARALVDAIILEKATTAHESAMIEIRQTLETLRSARVFRLPPVKDIDRPGSRGP